MGYSDEELKLLHSRGVESDHPSFTGEERLRFMAIQIDAIRVKRGLPPQALEAVSGIDPAKAGIDAHTPFGEAVAAIVEARSCSLDEAMRHFAATNPDKYLALVAESRPRLSNPAVQTRQEEDAALDGEVRAEMQRGGGSYAQAFDRIAARPSGAK